MVEVAFVEPLTFIQPVAPKLELPPPPGQAPTPKPQGSSFQRLVAEGKTERSPTPLDVMLYGMERLGNEAVAEADNMHHGRLKNGALQKFLLSMDLANKAAKFVHSTKVDAEIKGTGHEADLAVILGIVQKED